MNTAQQLIGPYMLVRNLGSGSTSKIKLAIHQETKMPVAIKIIKKDSFKDNPQLQPKIQREIALMRLFDHPHILKLLDILESPRHLYIGLEYASHGELFTYVVENKQISEQAAMRFFRQIIYGLEYLHSLGICHRDLKPENILLDDKYNIKIADFGFARFTKKNVAETSCGSPHYVAPEVIGGEVYDGRCADVWSCGVILYALLTGNLPFDDPSIRNLLAKVRRGVFTMPDVSDPLKDLISKMLTKDPKQRITIRQIKEHPAFIAGLPEDFVQPTPLPLPSFSTPIDPDSVSPDLRDILRKIGYPSDEELNADLSEAAPTMAKVFYNMLTTRMMLDQLDWDKCVGNSNGTFSASTSIDSFLVAPGNSVPDSFNHPASFAANDPCSLANPVDWPAAADELGEVSATKNIISYPLECYDAMYAIQQCMKSLQMQWFSPDETMIICRHEEKDLYAVATFDGENAVIVQLCQGQPSDFAVLCASIEESINRAIKLSEEEDI